MMPESPLRGAWGWRDRPTVVRARAEPSVSHGARVSPSHGAPMPPLLFSRGMLGAVSMFAGITTSLQAQLITPKTVPIHQGEQFGIYPSQWPSMGGVSIALIDTIGDPWGNPAKATRLTSGSIQVMPFTHHATAGGGRTLPVSILQTGGGFAGGGLVSVAGGGGAAPARGGAPTQRRG